LSPQRYGHLYPGLPESPPLAEATDRRGMRKIYPNPYQHIQKKEKFLLPRSIKKDIKPLYSC
jgi:hypothetical protein